jgi:hypothetical protein
VFLANRTAADFQAWRYQRDSTAWKYEMWDRGFRLPTQTTTGRSKCFCGADLTVDGVTDHVRTAHSFKVDKSATAEYSAPSPRDHSGNA